MAPHHRIAAIDYGSKRIGVAIADPDRRFASPYANFERKGPAEEAAYFRKLVTAECVERFVVGLPIHLSGAESHKSREARQFGQWLEQATAIPVTFFDERFTTTLAEEMLTRADLTRAKRKQRRDMVAAQILLTAFLEAGCPLQPDLGPLDG